MLFQPTLTESGLERFGLSLTYSRPCNALIGIVHSYLQIDASRSTPYPVIPDGTQAVFISSEGLMIGGAQSVVRELRMPSRGNYFGIRFHPGALRHFFDVDLSDITNAYVDAHYFPSRDLPGLHSDIYRFQTFHERANACEQWLLRHLDPQPVPRFDQALSLIEQHRGDVQVGRLALELKCSERHLNRLFRLHTGLSTKTFTKVVRLQHVCKRLHARPDEPLNTALELGYFDQAHLNHDFRKHLLSNPRSFFERFRDARIK